MHLLLAATLHSAWADAIYKGHCNSKAAASTHLLCVDLKEARAAATVMPEGARKLEVQLAYPLVATGMG